jgi:hypothetical protein
MRHTEARRHREEVNRKKRRGTVATNEEKREATDETRIFTDQRLVAAKSSIVVIWSEVASVQGERLGCDY